MGRLERFLSLLSLAWLTALGCLPVLHHQRAAFVVSLMLIGLNAATSFCTLTRKRRILIALNLVQIVLFGVLNCQLFSAFSEEHYRVDRAPGFVDWATFTFAHVLRAADFLDGLDEYGLVVQTIRHESTAAGILLVSMHLVVDVFLLGLVLRGLAGLWARSSENALARSRRGCGLLMLAVLFYVGLAMGQQWRATDWLLWPLDNILRLLDLADAFQVFGWRLHEVPRDFWTSSFAMIFRVGVSYWLARAVLVVRLRGFRGWGLTVEELVETLAEGESVARRGAIRALGGVGAEARGAVADLIHALHDPEPSVRTQAARALGQMGPAAAQAVPALAQALWGNDVPLVYEAVQALGRMGPAAREAAPDLCLIVKAADVPLQNLAAEAMVSILNPLGNKPEMAGTGSFS
jgi:hypothetical protein